MKRVISILLLLTFQYLFSQQKFKIIYQNEDYFTSIIADQDGNIIKKLDPSIYGLNYQPETLGYFSIFSIKDEEGWTAIDINENRLFKVLNTEDGTPSPDDLFENKIRIVDHEDKIGFANDKGKIIIKPQFEQVSTFYKGKAIIGKKCKKIPWLEHATDRDCQHYSTQCEKYGFINKKGKVIMFGRFTFEEIAKKINWKGYE
ncbi:WG repeat-containing protein [Kaistella jeonii]|uniref:WG repeat-containing protein n=1 Tax=Kaistella jeonii TaxID=266749 RepID=A0A0C1FND3_9FLAO|nr:WG repeat-containing protein [Kaistella jeonii]KIA89434.1 hypothetical protein OA86_07575 [Kaistella jeonii]SFC05559.1 WG containing repeat-containing protein [Kaistella jeonii]VEI96776.1 Uncharacterised protein [Kaistella jeonii]